MCTCSCPCVPVVVHVVEPELVTVVVSSSLLFPFTAYDPSSSGSISMKGLSVFPVGREGAAVVLGVEVSGLDVILPSSSVAVSLSLLSVLLFLGGAVWRDSLSNRKKN